MLVTLPPPQPPLRASVVILLSQTVSRYQDKLTPPGLSPVSRQHWRFAQNALILECLGTSYLGRRR